MISTYNGEKTLKESSETVTHSINIYFVRCSERAKKEKEKMYKLGLCVRYDCNNYGSMLQILATEKVIEKTGWTYELIRYDKKTIAFIFKNFTRLFNPYFRKSKLIGIQKRRQLNKYPDIKVKNRKRIILFNEYRKKYIGPYSPVYKGFNNLRKGARNYDAVMVGSDQLWTPAGLHSKFYNLLFVPDDIKKISLATSFGITEVPKNQRTLTKEYLDRIEFLSVRETSGADIVKQLIGRNALVAVDPTLLFSGKEWEELFPSHIEEKEPYIFAYFLGTSIEHRKLVEKLAKETRLKIITCPHMDEFVEYDLSFGDKQRFDVDPINFLNLIRGATFICTDSFHGTIFSILNHKKFITFNRYNDSIRKSKNTRIIGLFRMLELEERHFVNQSDSINEMIKKEINYNVVDEKLELLKTESFNFINKALNG